MDNFSTRLAGLRKLHQYSQKEVSQALGISQALLSHYENGIRECGLDFIIKASDFYGVTCDYLLGKSNSKYGFVDDFDFEKVIPEDGDLSTGTVYRASAALRETLGEKSEEYYYQTLVLYSVCIYRVLIYGVSTGKVPANWLNIKTYDELDLYINTVDSLMVRMLDTTVRKNNLKLDYNAVPPDCLKTIINTAHSTFQHRIASLENIVSKRCEKDVDDIIS